MSELSVLYNSLSPTIRNQVNAFGKPLSAQEIDAELKNPNSFISRCVSAFINIKIIEELLLQLQQNFLQESLLKKLANYLHSSHKIHRYTYEWEQTLYNMKNQPETPNLLAQLQSDIRELFTKKLELEHALQLGIKSITDKQTLEFKNILKNIPTAPQRSNEKITPIDDEVLREETENQILAILNKLLHTAENVNGNVAKSDLNKAIEIRGHIANLYKKDDGKKVSIKTCISICNEMVGKAQLNRETLRALIAENEQKNKSLDQELAQKNQEMINVIQKNSLNSIPKPTPSRVIKNKDKEEETLSPSQKWPPKLKPLFNH